jgi:hypothetical protein
MLARSEFRFVDLLHSNGITTGRAIATRSLGIQIDYKLLELPLRRR